MTTTIDPARVARITTLAKGTHSGADVASGACLLEAVAWLASEPWSDHPACVCLVLASFGRTVNDAMDDEARQRLLPFVPRLIGTRGSTALMVRRAFVAADYAVRVFAPLALDAAGLAVEAAGLRGLPPITSRAAANSAGAATNRARAAAYSAGAAAYSAGAAAYSARAATNSARAATYSAGDATNSARAATYSARAATYSAGAAAYSAGAATNSAGAAINSARAATYSAGDAAYSAGAAADSAGDVVWDGLIACLEAMLAVSDQDDAAA